MTKSVKDYKNIVFDMGGVLVTYTADNATWHFTDDKDIVKEIHNVMFYSQEWVLLDLGAMTDEKAISRILPRLSSDKVRKIAEETFWHWHEYNNVERPGVAPMIKALKDRGHNVYILSNVSRRLTDTYKDVVPAPELWDGTLFSGEVLGYKPQECIYKSFFDRFNLKAEDCFFIDDLPENVAAGKELGMGGAIFNTDDNKDLARILELE